MNKFIFADFKDFQNNLKKYLEKAKEEQAKPKQSSEPKEKKKYTPTPKDSRNYKRVEDPNSPRGYRFELKTKDDYIEDKPTRRITREDKKGDEYTVLIPGKTKEEQIKERNAKQKKRESFEVAKAGKKVLIEGRDDDEIATIREMLLAIANQPNEKKSPHIQREINFAKSVLGEDESGTYWLDKESSILRNIVKFASSDQMKYDIILKALADMEEKGLQDTPKYEQAKKALEKLEKRIDELATLETEEAKQKSESTLIEDPKIFSMKPKKEVDLSKAPRMVRTKDQLSPEELAQIEMRENRLTEEGEQLPDDEFKPVTSYLGWKQKTIDDQVVYVISTKQLAAISHLYENAQMRAQGLDPQKVRSKENKPLPYVDDETPKKKEKSRLEQQLEKLKNKKKEEEGPLLSPEEEEFLNLDTSIFDTKKTSKIKSLLTLIKQAQNSLKNVR
jgi:hypothetical protein